MKKIFYLIPTLIICTSFKNNIFDYVPNKETAMKIAEAVWLPIYGEKIYKTLPFNAELNSDTAWHVFGSLPSSEKKIDLNGDTTLYISTGGVPHIYISKTDGKILDVYHTR